MEHFNEAKAINQLILVYIYELSVCFVVFVSANLNVTAVSICLVNCSPYIYIFRWFYVGRRRTHRVWWNHLNGNTMFFLWIQQNIGTRQPQKKNTFLIIIDVEKTHIFLEARVTVSMSLYAVDRIIHRIADIRFDGEEPLKFQLNEDLCLYGLIIPVI